MILKVRTMEGWTYLDGIKQVTSEIVWAVEEISLEADMHFLVPPGTPADGVRGSGNGPETRYVKVSFLDDKGDIKTAWFNTSAYLLNDEGKTIEKL